MLSTATILDAVQQRIHDNTPTMRVRMLSWLNDAFQSAWLLKDWAFLETSASVVVASNKTSLPADFGKFVTASYNDEWFLHKRDQLTHEEAWEMEARSVTADRPEGWSVDGSSLYFWPSCANVTATLKYIPLISTYADNSSNTVWPDYFRTLFVRTVMNAVYEFEADERGLVSSQLDQGELDKIMKHCNVNQPQPQRNLKYLRGKA